MVLFKGNLVQSWTILYIWIDIHVIPSDDEDMNKSTSVPESLRSREPMLMPDSPACSQF